MKLQSHLQYENSLDLQFLSDAEFRIKSKNHRVFQSKKLELGDFVPCDEYGNVLEEKCIFNTTDEDYIFNSDAFDKYQQAKEKVLFEGFEVCNRTSKINCVVHKEDHITLSLLKEKTIEYLVNRNLTLTPNAIKQFNLEIMQNNFKIKIFQNDELNAFGAYASKSIKNGLGIVLFNLEANLETTLEHKDISFKEMFVETIMHEVGHALEEFYDLNFSEERIDKIIDSYREKYRKEIKKPCTKTQKN